MAVMSSKGRRLAISCPRILLSTAQMHGAPLVNLLLPSTALPDTQYLHQVEAGQSHGIPKLQGRSPWNKGKKMSEATRQKISSAQKRRWRESQGLRAAVVSKLKASLPLSQHL